MSNVFSRACASFVVLGGLAACASPSTPSAIPSVGAVPSGMTAFSTDPSGLTALRTGVTDETLKNAGWSCLDLGGGTTVCAQPGQDLPTIPFVPGGPPTYTLTAFQNHEFDHHVKFLRPDLFHGQPCVGGEPMELHPVVGYYHCAIPVGG
jgi:hypothetical protein